ncbi:SAG-related sequence [Besnoitia besnoiti]|uniref:SAG-related sequence n=1 Tax=Besnoitia besnoiti TaxID=94643 RepID=A0A2A9MP49_BESBE|nr:SAG-related sequence [Besnoitia besnoiti]PFH37767.1 SAG-related sequence [Besnoitia besnoiti]
MFATPWAVRSCGRFRSKLRNVVAVCVGGFLLSSSGVAHAVKLENGLRLRITEPGTQESASPNKHVTCNFEAADEQKTLNLTLSTVSPTVALQCTGKNAQLFPTDGRTVCSFQEGSTTAENCKTHLLQSLLQSRDGIAATITPAENVSETQSREWKLSLTETQFPRSDEKFIVGCKASSPEKSCTLTVDVKARSSSAENNVVTCAYGEDSNPGIFKVELTRDNNTLTLDCGSDGSIKPPSYTTIYCSDESLEECQKGFKEILPKFHESWWTKEKPGEAPAKLNIPPADFPSEDRSFFIGCAKLPEAQSEHESRRQSAPEQQATSPAGTCKVRVVLKAVTSTSLALPSVHTATAASTAAALAGVTAWF